MASISFANLKQNFSMWRDEIDNHATERQPDTFFTNTASGHYATLRGTGFEYSGGVPRGGHVDSLEIKLGGPKQIADVIITDIDADFADYAAMVSAPTPIDRTMAFWTATLAGDDTFDFGSVQYSAQITMAGDGYEAPDKAIGGDDAFRGDLFEGSVAADFISVGAGREARGGDDDIRLTHSRQATATGDVFETAYGSKFVAGDDSIRLDHYGFAKGDANTVHGEFVAGDDTIFGGDENDGLNGDVGLAGATSVIRYGNDVLHGGDGDDLIFGDYQTNRSVTFTAGNDTLFGDSGKDELHGNEGRDRLDGGIGNDLLDGGSGEDFLKGDKGLDTLTGGGGSDTADYSEKKLAVDVALNASTAAPVKVGGVVEDQIQEIENLVGGSGNDRFFADAQYEENVFEGRAGNDTLSSGSGRDTLNGGAGKDKLVGGVGADQFRFDSKLGSSNVDKVVDFVRGTDKIGLDDTIFKALGTGFEKSEFVALASGHSATNSAQHVIFDRAHGSLWYDADGRGGQAAVQFAQLGNASSETLNWHDFVIV